MSATLLDFVIEGGLFRGRILVDRLDAAQARTLRDEIDRVWQPGVTRVELDLGRVQFLDSSGVGALLGIYRRLPAGGGSVRLESVQAPVQSVLELLRLHRVFDLAS